MARSLEDMLLKELLPHYGITTIKALADKLHVSKQYAWLLWHGKIALTMDVMRQLHRKARIPLKRLIDVERATPLQKRGRPKGWRPPAGTRGEADGEIAP